MCARCVSTVRTLKEELLVNLVVGMAECDQTQYVELALGQVTRRAGGRRRRCGHSGAQLRVQPSAATETAARIAWTSGADELIDELAARTGNQRKSSEGWILLHGQYDHRRIGGALSHRRDRLQAGPTGDVQVQHEHGRLMAKHRATRGVDVAGLGHHLDVVLRLEQHPVAAHNRVVVRQHNRDRARLH